MPDSINPSTGEILHGYAGMPWEQIVDLAHGVRRTTVLWGKAGTDERAALLEAVAKLLDEKKADYALLITREMGKPIREARAEIEKCAWVCRYYAENGSRFLADEPLAGETGVCIACHQPLGVVLAVMPWNFPFWQVFRFAAPALAAGNGVILKHASNVCGCALAIESIFKEAGLPANLFRSIIAGPDEVEQLITSDLVEAVSLTGSEQAGRAVAAAAGRAIKKSVMELGGSDPYLILEDADLDHAAEICALSRLINNGQTCISAKRFIVARKVRTAFTEKFVERMAARIQGDPEAEATDLGPMARDDLRKELAEQVERSLEGGARLLLGGHVPARNGFYYPATILDGVRPGMAAADEELFGPVAAIMTAEDTDDAVRLANSSVYGLGAAVFSRNTELAVAVARQIQAGVCYINDFVKSDPRLPFGGIKRSGYGRELYRHGILEFVNVKTIAGG